MKRKKIYIVFFFFLITAFYFLAKPFRSEKSLIDELTTAEGIRFQEKEGISFAQEKDAGVGIFYKDKISFHKHIIQKKSSKAPKEITYNQSELTYLLRDKLKKGGEVEFMGKKYVSQGVKGEGAHGKIYLLKPFKPEDSDPWLIVKVYKLWFELALPRPVDPAKESTQEVDDHLLMAKHVSEQTILKEAYYFLNLPVVVAPFVKGLTLKKAIEEDLFDEKIAQKVYKLLSKIVNCNLGVAYLNFANLIIREEDGEIIVIDFSNPVEHENYFKAYSDTMIQFLKKIPKADAAHRLITEIQKAAGFSLSQPENIPGSAKETIEGFWNDISEGFAPEDVEGILDSLQEDIEEASRDTKDKSEQV